MTRLCREYPFQLPWSEEFFPHDIVYCGQSTEIVLDTGEILPNLNFKLKRREFRHPLYTVPEGTQELFVESDRQQAYDLGMLHKSGRRPTVYPLIQPYAFNADLRDQIERLRFL